jgi:hypothetical protein
MTHTCTCCKTNAVPHADHICDDCVPKGLLSKKQIRELKRAERGGTKCAQCAQTAEPGHQLCTDCERNATPKPSARHIQIAAKYGRNTKKLWSKGLNKVERSTALFKSALDPRLTRQTWDQLPQHARHKLALHFSTQSLTALLNQTERLAPHHKQLMRVERQRKKQAHY